MNFQPTRLPAYTRKALLAEIKRVVNSQFDGRCPSHKEFNLFSRVHSSTVVKEFGSWGSAMESAGFAYARSRVKNTPTVSDPQKITPDQLLAELGRIAKKHNGEVFQYEDYRRLGGKRARGTFCKYLGGWRPAVARIGLKDGFSRSRPDRRTYTDEEYFAVIQRLWELLGRQPKAIEMGKIGKISYQSVQQRFGSWMKAVYAFCEDRNEPDIDGALATEQIENTVLAREIGTQPSDRPFPANLLAAKRRTPRAPSVRLRFQVLQRDKFTCQACGRSPATEIGVILEVDHILAWSRGGETILANLQTLCARCNSGKSNL